MDELVNIVVQHTGTTQKSAKEAVKDIFSYLAENGKKEKITLHNFGSFYPKEIKGKEGVAPNGTPYVSSDKLTLGFKASSTLKEER